MYQILSAVGLVDNLDGKYHPVEVGNMSMVDIYSKYISVYLTLTHSVVSGRFILNMAKIPPEIKIQQYTLNQYLISIGNATLPVEPTEIALDYKTVRALQLWNCHFNFKPMNRNMHPDMDVSWDQQRDLYGTHPSAIKENLTKYGLFTVNGFVHLTDTVADGICIYDGCKSGRKGEDTQVGMLDFQHIGELKCYPITKSMLFKRSETARYKESVYIKSPVSMAGKTPFLVLGGYLHALDGLYSAVSDNVLKFDFYRYSWVKRFNLANQEIDLSSLNVEVLPNGSYAYESLMSDAVIAEWFTLSQSFIVLIDAKDLNVSTMEVEYSGLPGVYYTYSKPRYPLILGDGKIAEYSISNQRYGWVLRTAKYLQDQFAFELTDRREWTGTPMHRVTTEPRLPAPARFLIISKTIEVPVDVNTP